MTIMCNAPNGATVQVGKSTCKEICNNEYTPSNVPLLQHIPLSLSIPHNVNVPRDGANESVHTAQRIPVSKSTIRRIFNHWPNYVFM